MRTVSAVLGVVALMATTAAGATLTATAGLGGLARSGRWAPVRITVTNIEPRLAGDLVVSWGDATVRRRLVFDSPGTKTIDLQIRTSDVEAQMQVRFESGSGAVPSIALPIRIVRDDEHFRLCVADDPVAESTDPTCTVVVRPAALPVSPRGYEAADSVVWPLGRSPLGTEQAAALTQWESLKRLDAGGDLSLTPQAARPSVARGLPAATGRGLVLTVISYLAGLLVLGLVCVRRPVRVAWTAAGVAAAIGLGSGAMLALGRVGESRTVTVHHRSVLQQIPGTGAALLSMRAVAEFPSRGTTSLRLPALDGVIEASVPRGRADERMDADGFPTLDGTFGLGARRAFGAEAVVRADLLAVDLRGGSVRITNVSPHTMASCKLADGLLPSTVETLPPGGVIEAMRLAGDEPANGLLGPLVLCTTSEAAAPLTVAGRPVMMRGTTIVAAYLARLSAQDESGVP